MNFDVFVCKKPIVFDAGTDLEYYVETGTRFALLREDKDFMHIRRLTKDEYFRLPKKDFENHFEAE